MFIGQGTKFLNEYMNLSQTSNEKEWDDFEKNNLGFGFFKYEHLFDEHPTFFILYKEKEILAVVKTQKSSSSTDQHPFQGINYGSVKEKYQGQGLARKLYEEMFSYFSNGFLLGTDCESEESQNKLEKMSLKLAKENRVYFLTRRALYEIYDSLPKTLEELYATSYYRDI